MTNSVQYAAYQFGSFTLKLDRGGFLLRDGGEMPLRPKSFALLRLLVENAGRLLSRDAIMKALCPNVFVTDDNITQCIHDVRAALGAEARLILRTLPRRGYLFTSDVVAVPAAAASPLHNGTDRRDRNGSPPSVVAERSEQDEKVDKENAAQPELSPTSLRHPSANHPAERRQITVMACDMVGLAVPSTRLDVDDLNEVTAAFRRCCADIIEHHHGHVASYSTDGVLAYFGYPQADEHDAERAIQAGLALVDVMPKRTTSAGVPSHVSVGIATGLVVASGQVGTRAAPTISAVGSTPNLAVRLQRLAAADQILIAASTRSLLGNAAIPTLAGAHRTPSASAVRSLGLLYGSGRTMGAG
jgi:class 3 adenylate cyclase